MQYRVSQTYKETRDDDKVVIALGEEILNDGSDRWVTVEVDADEAIEFATKVLARAHRVKGVAV